MVAAPLSVDEEKRLESLYSYDILDTAEEQDYNHLVELASLICGTPMSAINFIDMARQWGKAAYGLGDTEASREISLCAHTILQDDVLLVEDTLLDNRFFDNPFTTEGGIRFYAGTPIRSQTGYNIGSLCVCDVKPKRLNEQQVEALKHLSRQVAVLLEVRKQNQALQQYAQNERQLKEKAEAARKAQEEFLSIMSHEIRTPLNGIIGMVSILETEDPKPEQKEYIETLHFASRNLLCVVNDVLDYNKIGAGKLALEEVEFDLVKLVNDIHKAHLHKANEKGIGLNLQLEKDFPSIVMGDPTRLTQILNNLIGNAIKFTLKGNVTIGLKKIKQEGDLIGVLFEISDTGIGFDETKSSSLFEHYAQANKSITRQFGGTGLGLAITRNLLSLMGSTIQVKSKPGVGSCFSFALALKKGKEISSRTPAITADKETLSHLRILIAEDNAVNVLVTRKILQKKGAEIDVAYNGKEAVEKLGASHYDLVLMDAQMPVMDGLVATKKIREEKIFTGPVILLTADAFINNTNEIHSWGFDDLLLKPFSNDELFQKIIKLTSVVE